MRSKLCSAISLPFGPAAGAGMLGWAESDLVGKTMDELLRHTHADGGQPPRDRLPDIAEAHQAHPPAAQSGRQREGA